MKAHPLTGNDHDAMLAKILGAATVMDHALGASTSELDLREAGKRLGVELAAMITAGVAPQLVLVPAFGIVSRQHFQMVVGMCEGLEVALASMTVPQGGVH